MNLSGGQKARVAFARILYHARGGGRGGGSTSSGEEYGEGKESGEGREGREGVEGREGGERQRGAELERHKYETLVVLDDPFSAVDVTVAHAMFTRGVLDLLAGYTVILALSSHVELLAHAQRVWRFTGRGQLDGTEDGWSAPDVAASTAPTTAPAVSTESAGVGGEEKEAEAKEEDGGGDARCGTAVSARGGGQRIQGAAAASSPSSPAAAAASSSAVPVAAFVEKSEGDVEDGAVGGAGADGASADTPALSAKDIESATTLTLKESRVYGVVALKVAKWYVDMAAEGGTGGSQCGWGLIFLMLLGCVVGQGFRIMVDVWIVWWAATSTTGYTSLPPPVGLVGKSAVYTAVASNYKYLSIVLNSEWSDPTYLHSEYHW